MSLGRIPQLALAIGIATGLVAYTPPAHYAGVVKLGPAQWFSHDGRPLPCGGVAVANPAPVRLKPDDIQAIIRRNGIDSVVVRKDNNLYLTDAAGKVTQLTHDGLSKGWPLFSPDGRKLAYTEDTDRAGAKMMIVIINRRGLELDRAYVLPQQPVGSQAADHVDDDGITYFVGIKWLGNTRIAISGALNPSLSETLIYDLPAHGLPEETNDETDFDTFSPDGLHYATEMGMPHWSSVTSWVPELDVDSERVFPPVPTTRLSFVAGPRWSPDGHSLAVVVQELRTHSLKLVVYRPNRPAGTAIEEVVVPATMSTTLPIDETGDDDTDVFYQRGGWVVTFGGDAWQLSSNGKLLEPVHGSVAIDPAIAARALRTRLENAAQTSNDVHPGSGYIDFWCKHCSLTLLPRRADND